MPVGGAVTMHQPGGQPPRWSEMHCTLSWLWGVAIIVTMSLLNIKDLAVAIVHAPEWPAKDDPPRYTNKGSKAVQWERVELLIA